MESKYHSYSLAELEDIYENIDREEYPERFEVICNLIQAKLSATEKTEEDSIYLEENKGIESKLGCEKTMLNGFWAALFATVIALIASVIGIYQTFEEEHLQAFNDPYVFIDVAILGLLTYYIYKKSRIASSLMFTYYLWAKLSQWFIDGQLKGLIMGAIFLFIFFNAMRATFIWHSEFKNEKAKTLSH